MSETTKTPAKKDEEAVKNMATASLVLGIVGVATFWMGFLSILGFAASIVGLVLAVKARKVAKTNISTAGLVLSIIGTCLGGLGIICAICVLAAAGSAGLINATTTFTY